MLPGKPTLFRIAPTPSGWLHQGNVWNFLLVHTLARLWNAQILLRIDDLDNTRFRPAYLDHIFETLDLLQIPFLGPQNPEQFQHTWSQHHRMPLYHEALKTLEQQQLLFESTLTRTQKQQQTPLQPPANNPEEKAYAYLPASAHHTQWQVSDQIKGPLMVPLNESMPQIIVRKKDGLPSYQLASVVDDHHFGVTHIVRGEDLLPSSAAQQIISSHLYQEPWKPWWIHHPLLLDDLGAKLSKSAGKNSSPPKWTPNTVQSIQDAVNRYVESNYSKLAPNRLEA